MLGIDVAAHSDESVQSYLLRLLAANRFRDSSSLYSVLGLRGAGFPENMAEIASIKKNGKGHLNPKALRQMQIPICQSNKTIDIGKIKLRTHQYEFTRRRYAAAFVAERDYYHLAWHIDFLPFCPMTFEILRERCPHPDCRRILEWRVCRGARYCDACGYNISLAAPVFLNTEERAVVAPLMKMCFGDELQRTQAELSLPPIYRKLPVGVLLQLPALFGRVLREHRGVYRDFRDTSDAMSIRSEFVDGAEALSKPQIFESIIAEEPTLRRSPFTQRLRKMALMTFTPEVQTFVTELCSRLKPNNPKHFAEIRRERKKRDLMSITEVTHALGVKDKSRVRDVIEAGLLSTETDPGDFVRVHYIRRADFLALEKDIEDRVELDDAHRTAGWKFHHVDQLVGCGLLQWHPNAAIPLLFAAKYLDGRSLAKLVEDLRKSIPQCDIGPDWIPLFELFRSMGPVHKPLAQIFAHHLSGNNLIGMQKKDGSLAPDNLVVPAELIGAVARGKVPWGLPTFRRHHMSQLEAQEYLNLHPKTISQLIHSSELEYVSVDSSDLATDSVAACGGRYIGALEIAARLGLKPLNVAKWMRDRALAKPSADLDLWLRQEVEDYLPVCRYRSSNAFVERAIPLSGRVPGMDRFEEANCYASEPRDPGKAFHSVSPDRIERIDVNEEFS